MGYTTPAEFNEALRSARLAFASGVTKDKDWRRHQLKRAWWMIEDNKTRIHDAVYADLGKHYQECHLSDCVSVQADILDTIKNLDKWTKDEHPDKTNMLNFLGGTTVRKEPLGVTLIIGAWNYPLVLLLQPMIAAIAAGCAIILKPSDVAPACENLLMEIIPKYLHREAIHCVSAGPGEMGHILENRFDHIFFTGSQTVAKIIHAAAARELTPVTLELGGQGPAIVTSRANIDLAAKRIASAKFMNAGQICLSVNHVLVDPGVRGELVQSLEKYFKIFMDGKDRPEYYTKIVNDRNFVRLENLLQNTSGKIEFGGDRDRSTRYFAPTIVVNVRPGDSLLSEELFGPILPIIDADLDTAISYTREGEHPLAVYAFTHDATERARVLHETQSGGVTFNDCMLHIAAHDAPFGGVGKSGQGYYHGRYGILAFSHLRTYIHGLPAWMESLMAARYPPYTEAKTKSLTPAMKVSFDRDGNELPSAGDSFIKALGLIVILGVVKITFWKSS